MTGKRISEPHLLITIVATLSLALLNACASVPVDIIGVDNPRNSAAETVGAVKQTIYVATTRARSEDPAILYTIDRNPGTLEFAKVDIYIPPNHKPGHVERPKSVPPDPENEFVILDPYVFKDKRAFQADLNRTLAARPNGPARDTLLFVHGFNTDFPAALMRGAQFTHDSGFQGVPIVFSWASYGKTLEYVYDLNSALHARDDLIEAASAIASSKTTGANLVAHSMGNLLTVEALRQAEITGGINRSGKLRNVILASPDIDAELFAKQLKPFPRSARKFYVLISADDKALAVSRKIAGGVDRVGDEPANELEKLGVTVIDLSKVKDTSSLNHTKFADSPEIVKLIGTRMNDGDSFDPGVPAGPLRNAGNIANAVVGSAFGGGILVIQ
ncbi:MAG: alpha/beta fold hydrolase [Roseibium sp.]|uniref:alpha/beta hydrolase n=1 Tax=Roseibium sp. TaxID=1936156 RepID=UPI003D9C2D5F